jgi:hypothetical protein
MEVHTGSTSQQADPEAGSSVRKWPGMIVSDFFGMYDLDSDAPSALDALTQFTKYATERSPLTSRDSISVTLVLTVGM